MNKKGIKPMRNTYYTTKVTCDICGFEKEYKSDCDCGEFADANEFVRLTLPFKCVDEEGRFMQNVPERVEVCTNCFNILASDLRERYNLTCVLNTGEKTVKRLEN